MSSYHDGRRVEYAVQQHLEANGYRTQRAASSKGIADVICIGKGEVLLVSVKRTNPILPPAERAELVNVARGLPGVARALVAFKPYRTPLQFRELTGTGPKDWRAWDVEATP